MKALAIHGQQISRGGPGFVGSRPSRPPKAPGHPCRFSVPLAAHPSSSSHTPAERDSSTDAAHRHSLQVSAAICSRLFHVVPPPSACAASCVHSLLVRVLQPVATCEPLELEHELLRMDPANPATITAVEACLPRLASWPAASLQTGLESASRRSRIRFKMASLVNPSDGNIAKLSCPGSLAANDHHICPRLEAFYLRSYCTQYSVASPSWAVKQSAFFFFFFFFTT